MKNFFLILALGVMALAGRANPAGNKFYTADHQYIQYTGRFDFSNQLRPKVWASGAYVVIRFKGPSCMVQLNDEMLWGTVHNYIEVIVDGQPARRLQLKGRENTLELAKGLSPGVHTLLICKDTEAENGYIELLGFSCRELLPPPTKAKRKLEFIGDSITCGFGADESAIKCGAPHAQWYDQHNAWMAYGPTTARSLNAQWHLSSVSGIGLIHSCCDKQILMPQVFDKVSMAKDSLKWNFANYQPDVVTVCLGQNDGIQDSAKFCNAYVGFAKTLRSYYPQAKLVFLTSPMADQALKTALIKYITAVRATLNSQGERNTGSYFFVKRSIKGCSSHPSMAEQQEIAQELTAYLKKEMKW